MNSYYLRLLDPAEDTPLFHQAYEWRNKPKSHAQPDRMSFEDFTAPDGITIGLFNGELQAVYFLHETEPGNFQCHFTSQRQVPRETLLTAARQVAEDFFTAGATELHAWVTPRNRPLRSFLESIGFTVAGVSLFPCQAEEGVSNIPRRNQRPFVKYVLTVNDNQAQPQIP